MSDALQQYGPPLPEGVTEALRAAWDKLPSWGSEPVVPPPPPSRSWVVAPRSSTVAAVAATAAAVGLGLVLVPRAYTYWKMPTAPLRGAIAPDGARNEAVVVLGGDAPLGRALVLHLAARELIVLASVTTDDARVELERAVPPASQGYVRAFVWNVANATEQTESQWVHAVHSTLSLRFPLNSPGDPYPKPGQNVRLIGIVNTLSFLADVPHHVSPRHAGPLPQLGQDDLDRALHRHVTVPLSMLRRLLQLAIPSPNRSPSDGAALLAHIVSMPGSQLAVAARGAASVVTQAAQAGFETMRREYVQGQRTASYEASATSRLVRWAMFRVSTEAKVQLVLQQVADAILRQRQSTSWWSAPVRRVYTVAGPWRWLQLLRHWACRLVSCK